MVDDKGIVTSIFKLYLAVKKVTDVEPKDKRKKPSIKKP